MPKGALPWLAASALLHVLLHGLSLAFAPARVAVRTLPLTAFQLDLVREAPSTGTPDSRPDAPSAARAQPRPPAAAATRAPRARPRPEERRAPATPPARAPAPADTGPREHAPRDRTSSLERGPPRLEPTPPAVVSAVPSATAPTADEPSAGAAPSLGAGMGAGAPAASSIRGAGGPAAASGARSLSGPDPSILRARYLRALRQRVLARREYPHAAQRAGLQGTVCLRFSLNAQGRLSALQASCGPAPEPLLQAALRAVRAAEPFGPLPSALGSELTVDLPVIFRLDEP